MQRESHILLRLAVWRCLPVRAIPAPHRQRAHHQVHRHLEALAADERSAIDHGERFAGLFHLFAQQRLLHALSGSRVYGGQHARPVDSGLRKILCPHWRGYCGHDGSQPNAI